MAKILITPRSLTKGEHPSLELLKRAGYEVACCTPRQQPGEVELIRLLPGCIGYLAGVATDVYQKEPPEDYSLARHERVIATLHVGAFTEESVERATVAAVENIIETLKRQ